MAFPGILRSQVQNLWQIPGCFWHAALQSPRWSSQGLEGPDGCPPRCCRLNRSTRAANPRQTRTRAARVGSRCQPFGNAVMQVPCHQSMRRAFALVRSCTCLCWQVHHRQTLVCLAIAFTIVIHKIRCAQLAMVCWAIEFPKLREGRS